MKFWQQTTIMAQINFVITSYIFATLVQVCFGRMDCAQRDFDNAYTDTGKVYCGPGFHECGTYGDACCNDVEVSPVQLTLVILGPATLLCTLVLTICVIKSVAGVITEEKQKIQSVVKYAD